MSIKLHTSLHTAQQAADEVKKEIASLDDSTDAGKKNVRTIETLANRILPILEKDRAKPLPQKSALVLIQDYAAHYPVLRPFIAQFFPTAFLGSKTRVFVKCNTGFGHHLFIRGTARGLSWDYGIQMRCVHDDLWVWETDQDNFDYKIVFDDDNEKGWEDKEGNRLKKGKKDKIIAPSFSRFNKNKNDLSEEEIGLNRIYKAQAAIEKGVDDSYFLNDRQLISIIKEVMRILCPEGLALIDENTSAKNYALECVLKYPFCAPFLLQLFPALPIEQITHLHPDSLKDPVKLAALLAELWRNNKIPHDFRTLPRCFARIGEVFAGCEEGKKLGFHTFIKILVQLGEMRALRQCVNEAEPNALIAIELAKVEATRKSAPFLDIDCYPITDSKALFEIFLISIAHSKDSLIYLGKYRFIEKLFPDLNQACEALSEGFAIAQICPLLASFFESQKWGNLDPVFKEILAIKNYNRQKAACIDLIHFLGCCALEEITPESFSYILDKHIIQALLEQHCKARNLLTKEIIAILKNPRPQLKDSAFPLFAGALTSRLVAQGMSQQTALQICKMIESDTKPARHLLDLLAELIDCAPYTQQQMNLIEQRLAIVLSHPLSLSSDLETLTNLLSLFGKDVFIGCIQEDKEIKTLFLAQLQTLLGFDNTQHFEALYGPIFSNFKENKTLISKLKKISKFPIPNRRRAIITLNKLVEFNDLNQPKAQPVKDTLDLEIVKMTAEIFNCKGFAKDTDRDKDHALRKGETVSEVQGSSVFCEKIVQLSKKTPDVLSPKYLRNYEKLDPTCLTLRYKRIGHVFNRNTQFYLPDGEMRSAEGGNETFFLNMLRAMFDAFACEREDVIPKATHDTVAETLSKAVWNDNVSHEKIAEIHRNIHNPAYPHSVLVGSGWDWHSTQIVFRRINGTLYMFYCNRGGDCNGKPGITICRIEKENLITPEFLKRIASRMAVKASDYTSLSKIQEELDTTAVHYIPMKRQKVGNCVYASLKTAIYTLLILNDLTNNLDDTSTPIFPLQEDKIKNAKSIYKEFSKYDAETILEDFLIELDEVTIDKLLSEKNAKYSLSLSLITTMVKEWLTQPIKIGDSKIGIPLMIKARGAIERFDYKMDLKHTIKSGR